MADDPKGQGPGGQEPQPAPQDGGEPEPKTFDAEYVKKLRGEAAQFRTSNKQLEQRLKELEEADQKRQREKLDDTERLKLELQETQAQLAESGRIANERALRHAVTLAAMKAEFNDPEDAWRMVDQASLELTEAGDVKGADEAIKGLVKAKPYLVKQKAAAPADVNAGNGRGDGKMQPDPQARQRELRQRFRI